jgi:hypothetical protein
MTTSTDGQICFGVLFEEGYEFPWDEDPWNGNSEAWWRDVNGYKPPFEMYNADGDYLGGVRPSQEKIDAYYAHRREWNKAHAPLPVEEVNVCSGDYPIYILAVPGTVKTAGRGYPVEIGVTDLAVKIDAADAFATWYLSSFWG